MAQLGYLASTLLMGLLVVLIGGAMVRGRDWRKYAPTRESESAADALVRLARSPGTWIAVFVLLVFGFGGGIFLILTGAADAATVGLALAGAFLVVLAGYVFLGTYASARHRGRPTSMAVAEGVTIIAVLLIVVVGVRLVLA
jgi:hypothetical protein